MKPTQKWIACILVVLSLFATALPAMAQGMDYTIGNPYATVDWDGWNQYRAQLHAHTLYSDGEMNITDVVEAYYAQGYDILAITDHGVVNTGWNKKHTMIPLIGYNQIIKPREIRPMDDARYAEITAGTDRGGRGMLDVSNGIEMNALTMRKNHVNGFFCGWGQSFLGIEEDFETPIARTEKAGGISFINHPGDFIGASTDKNRVYDWNQLTVFTDSLLAHPSCVGVEAFNCDDGPDRYNRLLWDRLLMYCIPRGRNVWGFSNDDSHVMWHIGLTAEIMLMPELSEAALRTAMENGTFFACSKIAHEEMGDEFEGDGNYAVVNRIDVDEAKDVITVTAENYDAIEWISDGEVIATGASLDLRANADRIGSYVRFQIKNGGGLLLSQPFVCDDGNMDARLIADPREGQSALLLKLKEILTFFFRRNLLGELLYRAFVLEKRIVTF